MNISLKEYSHLILFGPKKGHFGSKSKDLDGTQKDDGSWHRELAHQSPNPLWLQHQTKDKTRSSKIPDPIAANRKGKKTITRSSRVPHPIAAIEREKTK